MSAISLTGVPSYTPTSANITVPPGYFKQRNADVQQLAEALKSGDLSAAQQDYTDIVALGNKELHRDNPFLRPDRGQDFDAIGGALENGDLAGARQALLSLENTYKLPPAGEPSSSASDTAGDGESAVDIIA